MHCSGNVWKSIAQDNSGTIENEELKGFLKDLLELVKKVNSRVFAGKSCSAETLSKCKFSTFSTECMHCSQFPQDDYDAQDLKDFEETILRGVGYDKDGKISRKELTMILLTLAKMPNDEEQ